MVWCDLVECCGDCFVGGTVMRYGGAVVVELWLSGDDSKGWDVVGYCMYCCRRVIVVGGYRGLLL